MELVTERLILREMIAQDWELLYELQRDPEVVQYLTQDVATEASTRTFVEGVLSSTGAEPRMVFELVITERGGDGRLLGRCGLRRKDTEPRIGELWYVLAPSHTGRGYAIEAARAMLRFAFDELGLHRVFGDVDPRNVRSKLLLEGLGMRYEAHHVQDIWIKGEWCDSVIYAMLADEWAAQRA